MKILILAATLLPFLTSVAAQAPRYAGCYRTAGGLTRVDSQRPSCAEACTDAGNAPIGALTRTNECYCGTTPPRDEDRAPDASCDSPCPGAPELACGSNSGQFFSVYFWTGGPSPSSGANNATVSSTRGGNRTSTGRSSGTQTATTTGATKSGGATGTASGGSAPSKTDSEGSSAPSESTGSGGATSSNSGDNLHIGGAMLIGAVVMGVLTMVF